MNTDRNLLFGVLALELELITYTQFVEACEDWAKQHDASLGEMLVEKKWVSKEELAEVERLLERMLRRHKGDTRLALAETCNADIREAIRDIGDPLTRKTIDLLPPAPNFVQVGLVETVDLPMDRRSRYSLTKIQGQGGLGRVWLARDDALQRSVALKEPKARGGIGADDWRRFVVEAQITGQLEHPNIVPVYELVHERDSRDVFYTMRFVRGQTLSGAIGAYHERREAKRAEALELRGLLTAFIAICHALAYAHSRGVVHCDLKPSNVMLGAFGEVIVLDWGLAKVIAGSHDPDSPAVHISDDVRSTYAESGAVKGTVAYMSPEQAEGRTELIDSRTDIYGLGAILFAILCNQQPHRAEKTDTTEDMLRRIANEPTPRARDILSSVPPALDAICAKAMAINRRERYASAQDLAKDVERWLADQEVSVYRDPWSTRLLRWTRRHRAITLSAVAAGIAVTLVSAAAAVLVDAARRNEVAALAQANESLDAERKALAREEAAKREATRRFRQSQQTVDTMLSGVGEVLQYYPGAKAVRERLLEEAARTYAEFAKDQTDDPQLRHESARAYVRLGDVQSMLGEHAAAQDSYQAALDAFASLAGNVSGPELSLDRAACLTKLGAASAEMGVRESARTTYEQALNLLATLPESSQASHARASVLLHRGQLRGRTEPQRAQEDYEAAEALLAKLSNANSNRTDGGAKEQATLVSSLALARSLLGQALAERGEGEAAVEMLERAVKAFRELVQLDPDYPPHVDGLAFSEVQLASALRTLAREAEQARALDRAIADFTALAETVPGAPRFRENRAVARTNRAWLLHEQGNNTAAREMLDQAIAELNELYESPARIPRYLEQMAAAAVVLGQVLSDLDQNETAETNLQSAIAAYEQRLLAQEPTSARYERGLGAARRHLGRLWQKLERHDDAEGELARAVERLKAALARSEEPFARDELALAQENLGDLSQKKGRSEDAQRQYAAAQQTRQGLPEDPEYRFKRAKLLAKLAAEESRAQAREAAAKLMKDFPDVDKYRSLLGAILFEVGDYPACIRELTQIENTTAALNSPHLYWISLAYAARAEPGDAERAKLALERGVQRRKDHAPGRLELLELERRANR